MDACPQRSLLLSEILDLTCQSWDELSGKVLCLNGAQYILGDKVAEGAEKIVYPLRNVRTGLQQLAAKVFKDKPASELIAQADRARQLIFVMRIHAVSLICTR